MGEPPLPQVTLAFHPDWPFGSGTVLEAIVADGRYRSQFETATSNGGLTAHEGGDRWRWESRLFAGQYDGGPATDRPVYGALDPGPQTGSGYGGSPRFGSAYLRLRPEVTERATFCFPDSVFEPELVGGPELIDDLLAAAGESDLDDLDRYVEAHVHGGVVLTRDVEAVVLDPCLRRTPVEAAARRTGCRVDWHRGYGVEVARLDPEYRGAEYVDLARVLAGADGVLVPATIGTAARTGVHDPQALKRVWHLLARFGRSTD